MAAERARSEDDGVGISCEENNVGELLMLSKLVVLILLLDPRSQIKTASSRNVAIPHFEF